MASITKQVWEILDNDITIKKDLERGIINVSALSQFLLDKYEIKGSLDSVISAVRRYRTDETINDSFVKVQETLQHAVISTKTNITTLTLKNTTHTFKCLANFMNDDRFIQTQEFRLLKYRHKVFLVLGKESLLQAQKFLSDTVIESQHGVVELIVTLIEDGWSTRGILNRISNALSTAGVNVELSFSAEPSMHFFLQQQDLVKAHEALIRISRR